MIFYGNSVKVGIQSQAILNLLINCRIFQTRHIKTDHSV